MKFTKLLLILLLFTFHSKVSYSAVQMALSTSFTDVSNAVSAANHGDIVRIPIGKSVWTNELLITKAISIIGEGTNYTYISRTNGLIFWFKPTTNLPIRISSIQFTNGYSSEGPIFIDGKRESDATRSTISSFRVDSCKFNGGKRAIWPYGWSYGIIDHNTFINCDIAVAPQGDNTASWNRNEGYGTTNSVVIEDNVFIVTTNAPYEPNEQIYHYEGARSTTRYNLFDYSTATNYNTLPFESHGNYSTSGISDPYTTNALALRGQPVIEFYNNTISGHHTYRFIYLRGGSSIIASNTFTYTSGSVPVPISLTDEESWQTLWFSPLKTNWPPHDGITNSFFWNNYVNGVLVTNATVTGSDTNLIAKNRDYWMEAPNLTNGSPAGILSTYVPLTYPHPRVTSETNIFNYIAETNVINWLAGVTVGVNGGIPNRTTIYTNLPTTATADDISAAIQSAPSNSVVQLTNGTFTITNYINWNGKDGVTLRGHTNGTIIRMTNNNIGLMFYLNGTGGDAGQSQLGIGVPISSGYTKGSTNIIVSSTNGVTPNQCIIITQNDDTNFVISAAGNPTNGYLRQRVYVHSVASSNISFYPPLIWTMKSELNPRYYTAGDQIERSGVENIEWKPENTEISAIGYISNARECWFSGNKCTNFNNYGVVLNWNLFSEIRSNYIYTTASTSDGYGIVLNSDNSSVLVEDNILGNCFHSIIASQHAGCVFAYNFSTNNWVNNGFVGMTRSYNMNHGPHGIMSLWEGNVGNGIENDGYHGSASHQTIFRNYFPAIQNTHSNAHLIIVDLRRWSYYNQVIGNVLGQTWLTNKSKYFYNATESEWYAASSVDNGTVYLDGFYSSPYDSKVGSTATKIHNYDYWNQAVINPINGTLPSSLFRTNKPSWFKNINWPPIGPDVSGMYQTIPAERRFYDMQFPDNICVGVTSTGDGTGSDWNNQKAWSSEGWYRGDVWYLADGVYTNSTLLNTAESGTINITIKKATETDHGTDVGWVTTYGDGIALITNSTVGIEIRSGYWILDGVSGSNTNNRGIKISSTSTNSLHAPISIYYGFTPSNLTFKNLELEGRGTITTNNGTSSRGFYANLASASDWIFTNCYIHDVYIWASLSAANNVTIDNCYLKNAGSTWPDGYLGDNYHAAGITFSGTNIIIKNSVLENLKGGTTYIEPQSAISSGVYIYGNVYLSTSPEETSSQWGMLSMTSTDVLNDSIIANNTLIGLNGPSGISAGNFGGGTNVQVMNNLWYDCVSFPDFNRVTPLTCITNGTSGNIYFVSESTGDFRLSSPTPISGTTNDFNIDKNGLVRGFDGYWDIGAFEFNSPIRILRIRILRVGTIIKGY